MDVEQIAEAVFKGVESSIERALGPLLERLEALEQMEVPDVPTAAEVAKTILAGDEVATLVDLHVAEAVSKIEPIQGEKGNPGADGKDGLAARSLPQRRTCRDSDNGGQDGPIAQRRYDGRTGRPD